MDGDKLALYARGFLLVRLHVLDTEHPDRIAKWVSDRIKWCVGNDFPEGTPAIGVIGNKGQLLAGVVYHDYQEDYRTIQISMAADSPIWASKGNIRGLLHYPFRQLDCFKVWISTMHDKHHNIKTFEHVALKEKRY